MHLPRPRCPPTDASSIDTDLWQTCALEVIRGYYIGEAPQGMLRRPWRRRFSNWWQWAVPPIMCPNALVSPRSSNYYAERLWIGICSGFKGFWLQNQYQLAEI